MMLGGLRFGLARAAGGAAVRPVVLQGGLPLTPQPFARALSTALPDVLRTELEDDTNMGSRDMPEELAELMETVTRKMTIKDTPGESVVRLFSNTESPERLEIEFDVRDVGFSNPGGDEFLDEHVEEGDEVENLTDDQPSIAFVVSHTKGRNVLRFRCSAEGFPTIDTIEYGPTDQDTSEEKYPGPNFEDLDERVQEAFNEHLSQLGVDDTMCAFITQYAEYKEQQEYTAWLEKVITFTDS